MASPETKRRLTVAEYLQIEERAEYKSEFYDGEMCAISGGTPRHSLIGINLGREFSTALEDKPCACYNADLRINIEASGLFTYPDLSVVCGPIEHAAEDPNSVVNPTLIVEVLSESTQDDDRGRKFFHYRQIPSLREYLLVSQEECRVERFFRNAAGPWVLKEITELDSCLNLPVLGISIPLRRIYSRIDFPAAAIKPLRSSAR